LFCCNCRRSSYLLGIRFLQLCPVIERSLNKADNHRHSEISAKKMRLQEEAISEILVADTDSESGAEASNVEEEEVEEGGEGEEEEGEVEEEEGGGGGGCNQWQITNPGTASRKEHKYSSFCWSGKRCEN
jgi:hypothetical protein